jgi:hypothetical protein
MVHVYPFVYTLAEDHEICDVFGLGDLLILQVHGVEVAEEEVVYEAHVGRNFERFFGDLEMLGMPMWKGMLTSFEAVGEGMRANGSLAQGFVMMLDSDGTQKSSGR